MSESKYAWRPATKADIGSIARFGDSDSKHEPWVYGILEDIVTRGKASVYLCAENCFLGDALLFSHCQVQYNIEEGL